MTENRSALTRFAWLSIAASVTTIALKSGAYLLTNSVGFLSDAVESLVNLVAGIVALTMLIIAARPPDKDHAYGHSKAEYFASATEGILILVAAGGIVSAAIQRLLNPQPLAQLGIGLVVSAAASGVKNKRPIVICFIQKTRSMKTPRNDCRRSTNFQNLAPASASPCATPRSAAQAIFWAPSSTDLSKKWVLSSSATACSSESPFRLGFVF